MRIHIVVFTSLLTFQTSVLAKDYFEYRPDETLRRVREAVDVLKEIAPIPPLICKPNPSAIRYCSVTISEGLNLSIDSVIAAEADTPTWKLAYDEFRKEENGGRTYEISLTLRDHRSEDAPTMFVTLCTAAWMSVNPKLKPGIALERVAATLRKSRNNAATGNGEIETVGNPSTLIIDTWPTGMASCRISAEDDYRLPKR
jgi:hypothetical protein